MLKRGFLLVLVLIVGICIVNASDITGNVVRSDFEVDNLFLKVSVREGEYVENIIKVNSEKGGQFILNVMHVEGVIAEGGSFVLLPGEEREIAVKFNSVGLKPGVYVGYVEIISPEDSARLPVIFEIESVDVFYDVNLNVPPGYSEISPGGEIVAQLKIFDLLSIGTGIVDMEYYVKGIDGSVLVSESEDLLVSGNTQITKTLYVPEDIKEGDYVFISLIKYKSSVASSSYLVSIRDSKEWLNFKNFDFKFIAVLIFLLILFFGIIFLCVYLVRDRNKLFAELRRTNALELKKQREILLIQRRKVISKKGRTSVDVGELERENRERVKRLKKRHRGRVREFKKLKKVGNVKEMQRKLNEWKKRGYNTLALEYKVKGLKTEGMKRVMRHWEKKGYTEGYKKKK